MPGALVPVPPSVKTKEGKKRVWFGSATQEIITKFEQFLTTALGHQGPARSAFLRAAQSTDKLLPRFLARLLFPMENPTGSTRWKAGLCGGGGPEIGGLLTRRHGGG